MIIYFYKNTDTEKIFSENAHNISLQICSEKYTEVHKNSLTA